LDGAFLKIASWLLQLPESHVEVSAFTTGSIAKHLDLSRATVVRFCRHLGYEGFAEFKAALIQEGSQLAPPDLDEPFPSGASRVARMTLQSVEATLRTVDPTAFERAVAALERASLVVWFGCPGDSALLASSGEHKMTRSALHARATSDQENLQALARTVTAGDALVLISQSGRWRWVSEVAGRFRERGCVIITITSQTDSVMARAADLVLLTAARDVDLGHEALGLRAPQLMLVDMLVLELALRTGKVPLAWENPAVTSRK